MKNLLACYFIFFCFQISAELISTDEIFSNPIYSQVQLSNDGKYLSYYQLKKDRYFLTVMDISSGDIHTAGTFNPNFSVNEYIWLNDKYLYLTLRNGTESIYEFNFVKDVDDDGGKTPSNKNFQNMYKRGYIVDWLKNEPDHVMYSLVNSDSGKHQLYKILIEDLKELKFRKALKIDKSEENIIRYLYDDNLKRIIITEYLEKEEKINLKWRSIDSDEWQTLLTFTEQDYQFKPVGFISNNKLSVLSNKNTDKVVLHEFDIKTQTLGDVIYQHPKYDLQDADYNSEGVLKSVSFYQNGQYIKHYFGLFKNALEASLKSKFDDKTVHIIDEDSTDKYSIIMTIASDVPKEYYLYNKNTDDIKSLFSSYPGLKKYHFAKTDIIKVTSNDGTVLDAFLTKPNGLDHNTLLVMPHGGPIGVQDSAYFDHHIQFLVNRGFTILRVNFRGSSGYGKSFLQQGVGEFGQLIEEDISASVSTILKSHNYDNVCSIGSSYGGYSSVILAMKNPKLYKCVVASFGVYDLPLLFNSSNIRSGADYQKAIEKIVGKFDDSLTTLSPVYMAERLEAPILLIAGKADDVAGFEQSYRFGYMLKRAEKELETIFYDRTGHGHSNWWGDYHEMVSTVDFLYKTLSLTKFDPLKLTKDENIILAEDYATLADSYNFNYKVGTDKQKAYNYYLRSSEFNEKRSLYNVGSFYHRGEIVDFDIDTAVKYYKKSAELDYNSANVRLGRMYLDGTLIKKDFTKSFQYLSKAYELDDSALNKLRLARFYCSADDEYKDVDKCLEYFELNDLHDLPSSVWKKIKNARRNEIGLAFLNGNYNPEEFQKFQNHMKTLYGLTHIEYDLRVRKAGKFEYKKSEQFGKKGAYKFISKNNYIQGIKGRNLFYGVSFITDLEGIDTENDKLIIIAKWSKELQNGKNEFVEIDFLKGNPVGEWTTRRRVSIDDEPAIYYLELYNLNKKLLYSKQFYINTIQPEAIATEIATSSD